MRRAELRRDILVVAPSYFVPGVATLVSVPLLFHVLGARGYGVYVLVFALANGVPLLTGSWLEELTLRYGHRADARIGNQHVLFSIVLSVLVGALLATALIPSATPTVIVVTAASAGAISAYLVAVARLQSALRFGMVSIVSAGRALTGTSLAVIIAAVSGDPVSAAVGLTIGFISTSAFGLAVARPVAARPPRSSERLSQPLLGYGLASAGGAAGLYLLAVGDRFVLSNSRTLEEVGRYAAIYGIVDLGFRLVPSVLLSAVRPRLFRAWDSGDHLRASRLLTAYSAILTWLLGAAVLAVILVGPKFPMIPLDVLIAGPVALGLLLFIAGSGLGILLSASLRQGRLASHILAAAAANISLNIALVPAFGAPAAALVTSASFGIYLLLNAIALHRDGLLPDINAARLAAISIAAPAVGVVAAVVGQPIAGTILGAIGLVAAVPIIRAVLTDSPELLQSVRR
jgi:O-antigen/teichoic acid export membrane protein